MKTEQDYDLFIRVNQQDTGNAKQSIKAREGEFLGPCQLRTNLIKNINIDPDDKVYLLGHLSIRFI